jgi:hypothetical protein
MKTLRTGILALLCTLFAPGLGAQEASQAELSMVRRIVDCLTEGLPADWVRLHVVVKLERAGNKTGDVLYLSERESGEGRLEPYVPCDTRKPATAIVELRDKLPPKRRGWIEARLTVLSSGQFLLKYDFPDAADRQPAERKSEDKAPAAKKPAAKSPAKK